MKKILISLFALIAFTAQAQTFPVNNLTATGYMTGVGNITTTAGQFIGAGTGLTGTAASLTAGTANQLTIANNYSMASLTTSAYTDLGVSVPKSAPSATSIGTTSSVQIGGVGSNFLSFGQYPTSNMSWIQSSFSNPTTATYPISLQPLGGYVGINTGSTLPLSQLQVVGTTTSSAFTANQGISSASTEGSFNYGVLGYADTNVFGSYQTSVNSYAQSIWQNTNNGATASTKLVVSNDQGTATTHHANFGMNSSGFTGAGSLNIAGAAYLTGTTADVTIGTTTANAVHFCVNNCTVDNLQISSAGNILASNILNIAPTNTSTATFSGLILANDTSWTPPANTTTLPSNIYEQINLASVGLTGGTVQQRWNTTNYGNSVFFTTTGGVGTPASPVGMSDSHTIGNFSFGTIPSGLCDGQGGAGFTGPGGSPGNNCYQELGGIDTQLIALSPGHLLEGMSAQTFDDSFGSGGTFATVMTGFTAGIHKDDPANTYKSIGFIANSFGAQQTTFAPTSAYVVAGGWQNGIDLSGGSYNGNEILFKGGAVLNSSSTNMVYTLPGTFTINATGTTTSLNLVNTGANGSILNMTGNGGTTPNKALQVAGGNLNILNNAGGAIGTVTDTGNLSMIGNITTIGGQFIGAGTGLTGTASSLSIGGTATSATTATNQSGGTVSATTLAHAAQELDTGYTFNTPTTGTTVTLATGTETALIVPAGTLATLTVTLPGCTSGYNGSIARFSSTQIITSLTVNATSGTVADAPTTLALGAGHGYLCRGSTTTWYQLY